MSYPFGVKRTILYGAVLLLVAIYFLQMATPLRLHPDTVVLLSVAETAAHGGGYLYHGQPTVFPPGYPMLLAFLIRANLAHLWVIVGLNVVFVAIGLSAVCYIFRLDKFSEAALLGVCILSLLSFVFIKYSAIPLTDPIFFGVSMCCLALMRKQAAEFSWRRLMGSAILVITSICIRRIGIALIPAFLYMLLSHPVARHFMRLSARMKAAIIPIAAAAGGVLIWVIASTLTLADFRSVLAGRTLIDSVHMVLAFRLKELGETAVNLPFYAVPLALRGILPMVGTLALALVFAGVWWRKPFGIVETYFISYVAIILMWPFYDPRFWLPVIPFLIVYAGLALRKLIQRKLVMQIVECYVMLVALIGLLTIHSFTALSFAGAKFGDACTGQYHSTYCAVWRCQDLDSSKIDADALHLLRYYQRNSGPE